MNKREFVARALMEVCGLDDGMAFSVMMKAHQLGISVIGNYHLEQAEMYKIRLLEGMCVFFCKGGLCVLNYWLKWLTYCFLCIFPQTVVFAEGLLVDMIPADDEE